MIANTSPHGLAGRIGMSARGTSVLIGNGLYRPIRPGKLRHIYQQYRKFGFSIPLAVAAGAIRYPERTAIIDEREAITYGELDISSTELAHGLRRLAPPGGLLKIGVLAGNHLAAVQTFLAAGKLGADLVLLNTGLAGPQMRAVLEENRIDIVVIDEDLLPLLSYFPTTVQPVLGKHAHPAKTNTLPTVDSLITNAPPDPLPSPRRIGRTVILTAGTTGTPKGAFRPEPRSLSPIAAMLDLIPLRAGEVMLLCPPLFHLLGFAYLQLAMMLGNTVILRNEFSATDCLRDMNEFACDSLIASPIMLQRLVELPPAALGEFDTRSLRVAVSGGAPLSHTLPARFSDIFGPVLYNLYGSTEVSWATIATPQDLADAEDTVGKAPYGTTVRIMNERGRLAEPGQIGKIYVWNGMLFDGYTRSNVVSDSWDGMLSTGDLGCFDTEGRLFISGRVDDMVISGGENVYPHELEKLMCACSDIREAAAIGVPDHEYGQCLRLYLVPERNAEISVAEILGYIAGRLAARSVPRDVVIMDSLPRSQVGKVLRRELRRQYASALLAERRAAAH